MGVLSYLQKRHFYGKLASVGWSSSAAKIKFPTALHRRVACFVKIWRAHCQILTVNLAESMEMSCRSWLKLAVLVQSRRPQSFGSLIWQNFCHPFGSFQEFWFVVSSQKWKNWGSDRSNKSQTTSILRTTTWRYRFREIWDILKMSPIEVTEILYFI